MTQSDKVKQWLKKHDICGNTAWWDNKVYYNLNIEQIVSIARFLYQNKKN